MDHKKIKSICVLDGIFVDIYSVELGGYYLWFRDVLMSYDVMLWQCEFNEIMLQIQNMLQPDTVYPHQRDQLPGHSYLVKLEFFSENLLIFDRRDGSRIRLEHDTACRLMYLHQNKFECDWPMYAYHNCYNTLAKEEEEEERDEISNIK